MTKIKNQPTAAGKDCIYPSNVKFAYQQSVMTPDTISSIAISLATKGMGGQFMYFRRRDVFFFFGWGRIKK